MSSRNFGFDSKVFNNDVLNAFANGHMINKSNATKKGGWFNTNYVNKDQTLLLKEEKELRIGDMLFRHVNKSKQNVLTAYLEALLSNTEKERISYYGPFQTFVKQRKTKNTVQTCIDNALHAFSFGVLTFFSNRIKDLNNKKTGINTTFKNFHESFKELTSFEKDKVKQALRHQIYLQQFLNFYDRHEDNKLTTIDGKIVNIDLDFMPNDNHVDKIYSNKENKTLTMKHIDLYPIYQTPNPSYYEDKTINQLMQKNNVKYKMLFKNAYNELYNLIGINTTDYLNVNNIKNLIKFDKNNVETMIKKVISIMPEIDYEEFKKGLKEILSKKVRFQKQLIAEISSPENRQCSLIPFIICKENNKDYDKYAKDIIEVIEQDIKNTTSLIDEVDKDNFKIMFGVEQSKFYTALERLEMKKKQKFDLKTLTKEKNNNKCI